MSLTLQDLRGLPHTSVSQLKTFLQCPRKYRYQYIDRIRPEFRPIALAFGTAWHHAIGEYLLPQVKDRVPTREEIQAVFRDSLTEEVQADGIPVLFEDDEDLGQTIDLGLRMLDTFIERVPVPETVLGVEVPFVLELAHPTGEIVPMPFVGAMDAVIMDAGRTDVWELKSGKKKWSGDQLDYDLQSTAYRVAVRSHGFEDAGVKVIVTTKCKTPDVQIERVVRHRRDEQELVEVALSVLRAVNAGVDYRSRGWQCRSCAFAGACAS